MYLKDRLMSLITFILHHLSIICLKEKLNPAVKTLSWTWKFTEGRAARERQKAALHSWGEVWFPALPQTSGPQTLHGLHVPHVSREHKLPHLMDSGSRNMAGYNTAKIINSKIMTVPATGVQESSRKRGQNSPFLEWALQKWCFYGFCHLAQTKNSAGTSQD